MLGLIRPTAGTVELFGKPLKSFRDWWKIGYVPQKATHIESRFPFTVSEVVSLGRVSKAGLLRRFGQRDREAVSRALEQVHMSDFAHRLVTELSGGQQQRVFIAKSLVSDPEILILDEPTVGVDLQSQHDFYRLLAQLNREHRITLVVVSHDVDVIASEVNNVACVNQELVHHCEPKEFMEDGYLDKLYGQGRKFIVHKH
jgi:zinc transport system ATP-binding protein